VCSEPHRCFGDASEEQTGRRRSSFLPSPSEGSKRNESLALGDSEHRDDSHHRSVRAGAGGAACHTDSVSFEFLIPNFVDATTSPTVERVLQRSHVVLRPTPSFVEQPLRPSFTGCDAPTALRFLFSGTRVVGVSRVDSFTGVRSHQRWSAALGGFHLGGPHWAGALFIDRNGLSDKIAPDFA
jgi:hypothetical protein